jgi:hypothetical protein
MLDLYEEFRALVAALADRQVDYALCGGLAMAVYGTPRATVDIDLVIRAESLATVGSLARELGYALEAALLRFADGAVEIRRLVKTDPDTEDFPPLDLLLVTPALQQVWESRSTVTWEGGQLQVVSREGMIAMKSLRNNGQDRDDISRLSVTDEA